MSGVLGRELVGAMVVLAACTPPPPPPLPAAEHLPPPEEATQCGPSLRFANSEFFFADFTLGRSCRVDLEQEECVLAIFDDCTYRPRSRDSLRQWTGRIQRSERAASGYVVWLKATTVPTGDQSSAPRIEGDLEDVTTLPSSLLYAGATARHYFERVDAAAIPIGAVREDARVQVTRPSNKRDEMLPDFAIVARNTETELWIAVNWPFGDGEPGGLWVAPAGAAGQAQRVLGLDLAQSLAVMNGRGRILVAYGQETQRGKLQLVDTTRRQAIVGAELTGEILALAALPDESAWIVAQRSSDAYTTRVFALDPETLDPLGPDLKLTTYSADRIVATSTAGGIAVLIAASAADREPILLTANRNLVERSRLELGLANIEVQAMVELTGKNKVGLCQRAGNIYYEVDLTTQAVTSVPIALFDHLTSLVYDPASDRVFIGALGGDVGYIDRATQRAKQGALTLKYTPGAPGTNEERIAISDLAYDASAGLLYVLEPALGRIDTLTINP